MKKLPAALVFLAVILLMIAAVRLDALWRILLAIAAGIISPAVLCDIRNIHDPPE